MGEFLKPTRRKCGVDLVELQPQDARKHVVGTFIFTKLNSSSIQDRNDLVPFIMDVADNLAKSSFSVLRGLQAVYKKPELFAASDESRDQLLRFVELENSAEDRPSTKVDRVAFRVFLEISLVEMADVAITEQVGFPIDDNAVLHDLVKVAHSTVLIRRDSSA